MDLVKRCFGGGSKQQQRRPNRERLRRCFGGTSQKKKQKRSQRRFRASKLLSSSDEEETVHESMLQPSEEKETVHESMFLQPSINLGQRYQIEVYSSATGICKAPESNTLIGDFACNLIRGIFCNGAIHWLSEDATLIAYFNVHTDCIKEVPTPRFARKIHYFGESQGHLHLVNSDHQYFYKSSVLDVYELKGDYSGWFLKYQVDLASIASVLPQQVYPSEDYGTFMSIFRHEKDDDSNMVLLVRGKNWVEYNFKRKTTKRLCEHVPRELLTSPFPWTCGFNTHQFIPTLTCL